MSDIFQAAGDGDLARVKELLAQGGLDLAAFKPGWIKYTALYNATRGGHMDVVKALIRAGAPVNVPEEDHSPLHGAVEGSYYDLSALLLREGAKVDARNFFNRTPLVYAKERSMAALLIAAGADVNADPCSPLHEAAAAGRLDVLEELLAHPDINVNKQGGSGHRTSLHWAADLWQTQCVSALLGAGADACITDEGERTPLLLCFANDEQYSQFRSITMLVAAGDRQWDHLPSQCPGLESALFSVWKEAPQELGQLAARLEPEVKRRIQAALCTLHHASPRHLPDHIRMRLLDEAFTV